MAQEEAMIAAQVEDLRERMKLLQGDRRANIEIIQANKDANKDEIKRLRDENKELRVKIASVQRSGGVGGEATDSDLEHMRVEVMRSRKTYDTLHLSCNSNKKVLQELKDGVQQLELEARRPNQEDSPLTRNIRMLENRLDKAMIKYNEAQSIKKTYEQIAKRLREERIGFDSQLAALERTMGAKQRDYEELLLLSGDASHARDVAKAELDRVRKGYEEESQRREGDLRDRHQELALRRQTSDLLKQRAVKQAEIRREEEAKLSGYGDQGGEGNDALTAAASINMITVNRIAHERKEFREKISIFENAFRKIKDATGVSDVNEVIQKIVSQEGTTENLMLLTKENQRKISQLTVSKEEARRRVDEVKYAGPGGGHRRKMVDDKEEELQAKEAELERQRGKYEAVNGTLISVKAGVKHLREKLAPSKAELETGGSGAGRAGGGGGVGNGGGELGDDECVDVLADGERTMVRLLQRIAAQKAEELATSDLDEDAFDEDLVRLSAGLLSGDDLDDAVLNTRPHNQRVELPSNEDAYFGGGGGEGGEGKNRDGDNDENDRPGDNEDEVTRDKVKRASNAKVAHQQKLEAKRKAEAEAELRRLII